MIIAVMAMVVADVTGRVVLNSPIVGVMEVIKMAIPVIAFFMFPWATHESRHVRSTVFYGKLSKNGRAVIDVITYMAGAVLFILIVRATWPDFLTAVRIGEIEGEGALRIITWPTRFLIIFSSVLVAWQMLRCAVFAVMGTSEKTPVKY
jgi:TRAP-type mannitol/chloroaromatic compound transport system permease small subunit